MREPGTLKHRKELSGDRSGTEAWKGAPRSDYKKMSRGVSLGEQPELGSILLIITPPGSPLSVTYANDLSDETRHWPTQMYHHQAPLTETTSLINHDPVYCFAAERHHPDGWPSSKVQGVCVCVCVCVHVCMSE